MFCDCHRAYCPNYGPENQEVIFCRVSPCRGIPPSPFLQGSTLQNFLLSSARRKKQRSIHPLQGLPLSGEDAIDSESWLSPSKSWYGSRAFALRLRSGFAMFFLTPTTLNTSRRSSSSKNSCVPSVASQLSWSAWTSQASIARLPHFVLHVFFENIPHEEVFRVCRIF